MKKYLSEYIKYIDDIIKKWPSNQRNTWYPSNKNNFLSTRTPNSLTCNIILRSVYLSFPSLRHYSLYFLHYFLNFNNLLNILYFSLLLPRKQRSISLQAIWYLKTLPKII